jgi:hypothetical protein
MPIPLGVLAVAGAGGGGGAAGNAYELLETVLVGSGGQSSVSFSNLNSTYGSTYQHLQLRATIRTDRSGADSDPVRIRFNSDTGSNYARHYLLGYISSSLASGAATSADAMYITESAACANNAANIFAGIVTDILDPFETTKNKTIRSFGGNYASGWKGVELYSGLWQSTNALTTITLTPLIGTNFVQYTRFSLYGMRSS